MKNKSQYETKKNKSEIRKKRLKSALKSNMAKRKEQARQRALMEIQREKQSTQEG